MPNKDLKLSVSRIGGLTENEIWGIGHKMVENSISIKTFYGRGEIKISVVQKANLDIDPDDDPPHHANIMGWPKEKHEQQSIAIELAKIAELKLLPK